MYIARKFDLKLNLSLLLHFDFQCYASTDLLLSCRKKRIYAEFYVLLLGFWNTLNVNFNVLEYIKKNNNLKMFVIDDDLQREGGGTLMYARRFSIHH